MTLTHNDIAHLSPSELANLWMAGKLSHLVADFRYREERDGSIRSVFYSVVQPD